MEERQKLGGKEPAMPPRNQGSRRVELRVPTTLLAQSAQIRFMENLAHWKMPEINGIVLDGYQPAIRPGNALENI